jgi:hypothetical protein
MPEYDFNEKCSRRGFYNVKELVDYIEDFSIFDNPIAAKNYFSNPTLNESSCFIPRGKPAKNGKNNNRRT